MKALSILQPWAFAILHLGKPIENRRRRDGEIPAVCRHRGPLALHASKRPPQQAYRDDAEWIHQVIGAEVPPWFAVGKDERVMAGGIVGRCDVIGHVDPVGRFWLAEGERDDELGATFDRRWHARGSWGLVLANQRSVRFVPWKGQLGLFDVPDRLVRPQ